MIRMVWTLFFACVLALAGAPAACAQNVGPFNLPIPAPPLPVPVNLPKSTSQVAQFGASGSDITQFIVPVQNLPGVTHGFTLRYVPVPRTFVEVVIRNQNGEVRSKEVVPPPDPASGDVQRKTLRLTISGTLTGTEQVTIYYETLENVTP